MARLTKFLNCPACGERMKVAQGQGESKVCCPHCRQKVIPEPDPAVVTSTDFKLPAVSKQDPPDSVPTASSLLNEILLLCKEKRLQLTETQHDLQALEDRARAIGDWLKGLDVQPEDSRAAYATVDLQYRLFDQLKPLKISSLEMIDCDHPNEKSLAKSMALTFEAFGWEIHLTNGELAQHCGEEITFFVAPGPVSHAVAIIHFALSNSGLRLHSRVALEQPREVPLLYVHRISNIPKLLPSPKSKGADSALPLRKSA